MKYKVDQPVTFLPLKKRAQVVHVTPYHDSADQHATVTIKFLDSSDTRTIPVAVQDQFLSTEPPKSFKFWPLGRSSSK